MILFGASGHSKVILDILSLCNRKVKHILDDSPACTHIFGVQVLKNIHNSFDTIPEEVIISIGNNEVRQTIAKKYNWCYTTAVHPSAILSEFSTFGFGSVAMARTVVNAGVEIGTHCIVNTGSIVEHDCVLEDFVHLSPHVTLAGNVLVGEGAHIGIGALVLPGVKIGKWAKIGAGAVVTTDVPNYTTVIGSPARIVGGKIPEKINYGQ